jgi:GNAT superfamily N-acetyltransferase
MDFEKFSHATPHALCWTRENASTKSAMEAVRRYDTRYGSVILRPELPEDEAFLYALFSSHTARPLKQAGLADLAIDRMVRVQFRSQTATHRNSYPDAIYSIIESDGAPIGRLIEADEGDSVYFVDFALLPERQAKGLGTAFIEQIAEEWAAKGRAARVEVQYHNEPSLKLCHKLGFAPVEARNPAYVNLLRRTGRPA